MKITKNQFKALQQKKAQILKELKQLNEYKEEPYPEDKAMYKGHKEMLSGKIDRMLGFGTPGNKFNRTSYVGGGKESFDITRDGETCAIITAFDGDDGIIIYTPYFGQKAQRKIKVANVEIALNDILKHYSRPNLYKGDITSDYDEEMN